VTQVGLTQKAESILSGLNEVQRQAAQHGSGPLVVFAGAGSGKTRIITSRIALLMEQGVRPSQILAVTFTNKAANEMKERVRLLTSQGSGVHIGTFHSSCARWLREFAPELGFSSDFTIYDEKDSLAAIKIIMGKLKIATDDGVSAQDYRAAIGKAKTFAWLPADAKKYAEQYSTIFPKLGVEVYKLYQELLASSNAMDFGDLLLNMLMLLKRNEGVRRILQRRYQYILVDEYQDTNPTQFELISYLVNESRNLFVVGDDDQSIYSWRGADPSNILEFGSHYQGAVKIALEQNYRCTGHIVNAASALIVHNKARAEKTLWTENADGDRIGYVLEYDGEMEAWTVVDLIKNERNRFAYSDIAIFYRTNAQSRQIEEVLRRENIPYRIYGSLRFYDRAEIKDILSYIRLALNPNDDVAFNRVINIPARGIGAKAQSDIAARANAEKISLLNMSKIIAEESSARISSKLKVFVRIIEGLLADFQQVLLPDIVQAVLVRTDYKSYVEKKFPDQIQDKIANIHEIAAALADYVEKNEAPTLSGWMQDISLSGSEDESKVGVTLMTLHSAKGLEFKRVFVVGVEDNLIPHSNSMNDPHDLEEERRLLYVGMTRAKEKLTLLSAQKRRVFNNWMANRPSRFLAELPEIHMESGHRPSVSPAIPVVTRISPAPAQLAAQDDEEFVEGATVRHPTYGRGVIERVEDEYGIFKATVEFRDFGKRKVNCSQLESQEITYDFEV
jgi:DNA helicase-2/ATP-dependent DNA helicase PcrA